jgi:cyanuric acid amidohydrolase
MECSVYRVPMRHPGDVSSILRLLDDGTIAAEAIAAIFGKTEGNGCVNDFTRGYALSALSAALAPRLEVAVDAVASRVAMVMSGGTEGGLSPHFLVFAAVPGGEPTPAARLWRSGRPRPLCCARRRSAAWPRWRPPSRRCARR